MREELLQLLRPIRRRLRIRHLYRAAFSGLLVGALLTLLHSVLSWQTGISETFPIVMVCIIPAAITAFAGLTTLPGWEQAAAAADRRYGFKDRVLTALKLSETDGPALANLQIQDAVHRLEDIYPEDVVRLEAPVLQGRACAALLVLSFVLLLLPLRSASSNVPATAPSYVGQNAVQQLQEEMAALDQMAEESESPELQVALEELRQAVARLDPQRTTARDALEAISQVQQRLKDLSREMNVAAVDRQLDHVADALAVTDAFRESAEALQRDALQKAADHLKDSQPAEIPPEQALAAAEKLADAAEKASEQDLPEWSDTLKQLSDAIAAGQTPEIEQQALQLAEHLEAQQELRSLQRSLDARVDALDQKKKLTLNSNSEGNGMAANATGLNRKEGKSDRQSNSSSRKAGAKSTGNPLGEQTRLDATRQMARLQGKLNETGVTDQETTIETESNETASRQAVEVYSDYQKLSEAVLESEPVPLGQKELIRRYFEQIRPASADSR